MKKNRLLSAAITLFLSTAANAAVQGSVFDESGAPIKDAVVSIKTLPNLLPDARTLSNAKGKFTIKDKVADPQVLIVRKTGFLPETLSVAAAVVVQIVGL